VQSVLKQCLEVDPADAPCNTTLGIGMLRTDPPLGERLLRRALPRDLSGDAHFALARHLVDTGRGSAAIELLTGWLRTHTTSVEQLQALAALALRAGDYPAAESAVRNVLRARVQRDPASPPPAQLLRELVRAPEAAPLAHRVHDALAACTRSDCVQRAIGW
jgi:DNA-binding SARP family transcriptional activator